MNVSFDGQSSLISPNSIQLLLEKNKNLNFSFAEETLNQSASKLLEESADVNKAARYHVSDIGKVDHESELSDKLNFCLEDLQS